MPLTVGAVSQPEPVAVIFERLRPPVLPFEEYAYPFLEDEDPDQSISLGTVTEGRQYHAAELSLPNESYRILPRQLLRNLRFGTTDLVGGIERAADEVAYYYPGSVLWVGNIGARAGGDISWSVSHNSGRDADLAFYFSDGAGEYLDPPDLMEVGRRLSFVHEGITYDFDLARNWELVRALLEDPHIQIQFLFIANHLRRALLAYGRDNGAAEVLIQQAETVLVQPGRHIPHDDHLHIRIYCSEEDIGLGCVNLGRIHPWVNTYREARRERIDYARGTLAHPLAEFRARAVERLILLDDLEVDDCLGLLEDRSPRVRAAALRGLAAVGTRSVVDEVAEMWIVEDDPLVLEALIETQVALGGDEAIEFLRERLADTERVVLRGVDTDVRALAADGLGDLGAESAVEDLIALLSDDDAFVRARVSWALGKIANVRLGQHWEDPTLDTATVMDGLSRWQQWWTDYGWIPRDGWLMEGLVVEGFEITTERVHRSDWVQAVGSDALHVRYNAQSALMRMMDRDVASLRWPTGDAQWYWRRATR